MVSSPHDSGWDNCSCVARAAAAAPAATAGAIALTTNEEGREGRACADERAISAPEMLTLRRRSGVLARAEALSRSARLTGGRERRLHGEACARGAWMEKERGPARRLSCARNPALCVRARISRGHDSGLRLGCQRQRAASRAAAHASIAATFTHLGSRTWVLGAVWAQCR